VCQRTPKNREKCDDDEPALLVEDLGLVLVQEFVDLGLRVALHALHVAHQGDALGLPRPLALPLSRPFVATRNRKYFSQKEMA
jgi:hypothetical protein